ncbi:MULTISPECIES: hypothetical protein [Nostocales]|nr:MULTISPECIES: hypothetical protein [Nostocales]MBO1063853.1 hypothetical protein [Anabaena sp. 54]
MVIGHWLLGIGNRKQIDITTDNGQRTMDNGQLTTNNGQRTTDNKNAEE